MDVHDGLSVRTTVSQLSACAAQLTERAGVVLLLIYMVVGAVL